MKKLLKNKWTYIIAVIIIIIVFIIIAKRKGKSSQGNKSDGGTGDSSRIGGGRKPVLSNKNAQRSSGVVSSPSSSAGFNVGDMVYMATSLTDASPLFIYGRPTTADTTIGSSRPDWYTTQPIAKFKAYSSDKQFALVTFNNLQIWKGNGTTKGTLSGDYFVPIKSISNVPY